MTSQIFILQHADSIATQNFLSFSHKITAYLLTTLSHPHTTILQLVQFRSRHELLLRILLMYNRWVVLDVSTPIITILVKVIGTANSRTYFKHPSAVTKNHTVQYNVYPFYWFAFQSLLFEFQAYSDQTHIWCHGIILKSWNGHVMSFGKTEPKDHMIFVLFNIIVPMHREHICISWILPCGIRVAYHGTVHIHLSRYFQSLLMQLAMTGGQKEATVATCSQFA